ncbi:GDSL-type esterase/lipase family protein [Congregibacter sp.]|uniref:GDSL-type esterase/lipase family protein n=1 Tax=Congregibacter sp. TaxID=2744308 RepID=UPI00385D5F0B
MRTALYALLTAFCLVGCSDPALKPLSGDATILAFGDSLTYGTGAPSRYSYPAVLEKLTGLKVINAGVPGELSAEGLVRLPMVLQEHTPDMVVLVHGGNDTLRNVSPELTQAKLDSMIQLIRTEGADVVMLGVPGRNLTLSVPSYYGEIADRLGVPMDDTVLPRLMRDRSVKSDAVHFNQAGYRRMAEAVQTLLAESGAISNRHL